MKFARWALMGLLSLWAATAQAQRSGTGVGVILGEPTGLSLKHWVAPDRAVDAAVAWSLADHDSLQLHGDYLFHRFDVLDQELARQAVLYYGLGGRLRFNDGNDGRYNKDDEETTFGVRFPVGLEFFLTEDPIDIFVELVPALNLAPSTEFDLDAAFGARFFFR